MPQKVPKRPQDASKMPPERPQDAPKNSQDAPNIPKMPSNSCMCPNLLPKYFYMLQLNAKMRAQTPTQPHHARTIPQKPVHNKLSAAERAKRAESVLNSKL